MLTYRCQFCRVEVEVKFVAYDHVGPGLQFVYRCHRGHVFRIGTHQIQPRRVPPPSGVAVGPAGP